MIVWDTCENPWHRCGGYVIIFEIPFREVLLQALIQAALGKIPADLVLKNGHVLDVHNQRFTQGDLAIHSGHVGTRRMAIQTLEQENKRTPEFVNQMLRDAIESSLEKVNAYQGLLRSLVWHVPEKVSRFLPFSRFTLKTGSRNPFRNIPQRRNEVNQESARNCCSGEVFQRLN